jgi:hypothetical protein
MFLFFSSDPLRTGGEGQSNLISREAHLNVLSMFSYGEYAAVNTIKKPAVEYPLQKGVL